MRDYNCELVGKVISVEENPEGVEFCISTKRPSGKDDVLPIIASSNVIGDLNIVPEITVNIKGIIKTIRSKNSYKSRLRIEATKIEIVSDDEEHKNKVFGRFEVKTSKSMRTTKTGYKIKDIVLKKAISEEAGISEFRAVLWNEAAEDYNKVMDGSELYIVGRLQSREYFKKTEDGSNRVRTYEVSVGKIENDTDLYAEEA